MNPAKMIKLLSTYGRTQSSDLTPSIVGSIADALGYEPTVDDATFTKVVDLLRTENIDTLADIIPATKVHEHLKSFFKPKGAAEEDTNLAICWHCGEFSNPQV